MFAKHRLCAPRSACVALLVLFESCLVSLFLLEPSTFAHSEGDCDTPTTTNNAMCVYNGTSTLVPCQVVGQCFDQTFFCYGGTCNGDSNDSCLAFKAENSLLMGNGCLTQPPESNGKTCKSCVFYWCYLGHYYDYGNNCGYGCYDCYNVHCEQLGAIDNSGGNLVCPPS